MPGISAVSPPIKAHPFASHPRAMPAITCTATLRLKFTGGQIVEKKQRLRSLYGYIVYAVVDQVLADCVVAPRGEGDFELRSHAVHGAYKHGLAHFRQRETAAERTYVCEDALCKSRPSHSANSADGALGLVDVDAGILI